MSSFRVDLRSDTVTKPTEAMRRAMAEAEVGDDWYDDDPTVNLLQERCAEAVGKEAGLFVPTGTMANQIGLRLHFSGPGHLVAAAAGLHVTSVEVMTAAALAGIAYRTIDAGPRGWIDAEQAAQLLEPDEFYDVEVIDLLSVENTVGGVGGRVMPLEELRAVRKVANEAGVPIHLDGARIFNAADRGRGRRRRDRRGGRHPHVLPVQGPGRADRFGPVRPRGHGARGQSPEDPLRRGVAAGRDRGRRRPDRPGGGPEAPPRGPRARPSPGRGRGGDLPGSVDLEQIETNMVFVDTEAVGLPMLEAIERLAALGVGVTHSGGKIRMVTHLDVDDAGIGVALDAWRGSPPK